MESSRTTRTGKAKSKPKGHRPGQLAGIRSRGKKGIPRKQAGVAQR